MVKRSEVVPEPRPLRDGIRGAKEVPGGANDDEVANPRQEVERRGRDPERLGGLAELAAELVNQLAAQRVKMRAGAERPGDHVANLDEETQVLFSPGDRIEALASSNPSTRRVMSGTSGVRDSVLDGSLATRWPTNGIRGGTTRGSPGCSFRRDTCRRAVQPSKPRGAMLQDAWCLCAGPSRPRSRGGEIVPRPCLGVLGVLGASDTLSRQTSPGSRRPARSGAARSPGPRANQPPTASGAGPTHETRNP